MIECHEPMNPQMGPHLLDGKGVWAHAIHMDMLAWYEAGEPVRTLVDAQGFVLERFPYIDLRMDRESMVWDVWLMLCPAFKVEMGRFLRKWPVFAHRPLWEPGVVPLSHVKYLPILPPQKG